MEQGVGASADADRATAVEPVPVSPLRDGIPSAWRVAVINHEERPCAIIRDDGPWGDEFVASDISITDARAFAAMGIRDCLPSPLDLASMDDTDWHVLAQDISGNWHHPAERAVAYQAAGEAIKLIRAAQGIETRRAETGTGSVHESPVDAVDAPR